MRKADAVAHFGGSQIAVARALNISKGAVSQWPELIPLKSALRLQGLTNGALSVDMSVYELPALPIRRPARRHAHA